MKEELANTKVVIYFLYGSRNMTMYISQLKIIWDLKWDLHVGKQVKS